MKVQNGTTNVRDSAAMPFMSCRKWGACEGKEALFPVESGLADINLRFVEAFSCFIYNVRSKDNLQNRLCSTVEVCGRCSGYK